MKSVARLAPALAVCDSHMDVLRANFNDSLPAVRDAIAAADFIAVDCEFTGLSPTDGADRSTRFDLPDDRFDRAARSVANFALIQFGVSVFNFDQDSKQLTAKLFDFYCFPRGFETWNEKRFLCQASSIQFLSSHGFDFQKWVTGGIPSLSLDDEAACMADEAARADKRAQQQENNNEPSIAVSPRDIAWEAGIRTKLVDFQASATQTASVPDSAPASPLELEVGNGFYRRVVHSLIGREFPSLFVESTVASPRPKMIIRYVTPEEKAQKQVAKLQSEREAFQSKVADARGVRLIFEALSQSGKPIIGHNSLLDMCHIFNTFVGNIATESFNSFRQRLLGYLPTIFDTKYLVSQAFSGSTDPEPGALMDAFVWADKVLSAAEIGFSFEGQESNTKNEHDASYDAYLTGVVFAASVQHFQNRTSSQLSLVDSVRSTPMTNFCNKIHLHQSENPLDLNQSSSFENTPIFHLHLKQAINFSELRDMLTLAASTLSEVPQFFFQTRSAYSIFLQLRFSSETATGRSVSVCTLEQSAPFLRALLDRTALPVSVSSYEEFAQVAAHERSIMRQCLKLPVSDAQASVAELPHSLFPYTCTSLADFVKSPFFHALVDQQGGNGVPAVRADVGSFSLFAPSDAPVLSAALHSLALANDASDSSEINASSPAKKRRLDSNC